MKWISAKDRLPKKRKRVSLFIPKSAWPHVNGYYNEEAKLWVADGWGNVRTARVTHWRELPPDPPKGGE